jgi:hypothetical protein
MGLQAGPVRDDEDDTVRTFLNGAGEDSTAAVLAYLAVHRELTFADLYLISTSPCYAGEFLGQTFLLTDYPSPLMWGASTFVPADISRDAVESKIGLDAASVDVQWGTRSSDVLASNLSVLQGFFAGCFDNGTVEIWRCIMPTPGDCNSLGACLMFSGRITNLALDRMITKFTVLSRMETLNVQVPTNLIEPGNILTQYSVGVLPLDGPPAFTILAGSTASKILADPTTTPAGYVAANDTYDMGYIVIGTGAQLGGSYGGIRMQTIESGHHAFYLSQPLPFAPTAGDSMNALIPVAAGYSLVPFNEVFPAVQSEPGSNWTWQLNGSTLTGNPSSNNIRTYSFIYHDGLNDVYFRTAGGVESDWNDNWPVVAPNGTVTFPGASTNVQPPQNEPGMGSTAQFLGFPYVPVPQNSSVTV